MQESKYPPHPYATAFTLMEGDAFRDLVADIKLNGQRVPIMLAQHDNEWCLLDGRNRERACFEAGVTPRYDYYDGKDPQSYVKSLNHYRRHQNADQRALCAARLADMKVGNPQFRQSAGMKTLGEAAKEHDVSERSAERARSVLKRADPEVVDALEQGEISLSKADEIARLEKDQQLDALEQAKNTEAPRTKVERDSMMSIARLMKESEVMALRVLVEAGEWFADRDARAREGVKVLLSVLPMVRK